jgi:hypothetical protein
MICTISFDIKMQSSTIGRISKSGNASYLCLGQDCGTRVKQTLLVSLGKVVKTS